MARIEAVFRRYLAVFAVLVSAFGPSSTVAQGPPQYLEVVPLSDLDYGVLSSGAGSVTVDTEYPYIASFQIRARLALPPGTFPEVDLTFVPPASLSGPGDAIPYTMNASTNSQVDNPDGSTPVSGTTARITLENYEGTEQGLPVYSAYAYAFGTIDVSSSAHGGYNASLQLRAEPVFNVPPICLSDEWNPNRRYRAGDSVTYDGAAWEANRRTRGDEPGAWPGGGDDDDDEDEDEDDDDEEDDEDGGGSRITICHIPPGNPGNQQTMTVSRNALSVHLGHGDHEGPCLGDGDGDDDDGFGPGSPWDLITTCP